jgi:hypothetical protein
MAARGKKKLSKVTPSRTIPNQEGTFELHSPGIFGPRSARIRSDEEAARSMKARSPELQKLLGLVLIGLPATGTPELSLLRNREIQQRMVQHAQAVAEVAWPGFNAMMKALSEREAEFVKALGEIGTGVA